MKQNPQPELRLIPRGQGFNAADCAKPLDSNSDKAKKITEARKTFQRFVTGEPENAAVRMTRDERPFISKIYFVHKLQLKRAIHDKTAMLLSLLADRVTLFSRKYQIYRTDHSFYRALGREYSQTEKDERQNCLESQLAKQQAGHYKPAYNERDHMEYLSYMARRNELKTCWGKFMEWKFKRYKSIFQNDKIYSTLSDYSVSEKEHMEISSIFSATRAFFQKKSIKESNVVNIIDCIKDCPSEGLYPFHYLMVCVAGTERLFSTQTTVYGRKVLNRCRRPYCRSKPVPLQRIERIAFLNELNHIFGLNQEDRSRNWNAFLQVHGTKIESQAELEQWRKIIYDENGTRQEDIPPIELTLLCMMNLRDCVPVEYDNLYCYRGGSAMHKGGFKRFLDSGNNRKIVNECAKRIRRGSSKYDWPHCEESYLKEWARLECDIPRIQKLCCDSAKIIRWGTIKVGINESMKEFCSVELQRQRKDQAWLDRTVVELKSLLIETALRRVLKDTAVDILAKEMQDICSQNSRFKVYLTDFRELIPD